MAAGTNRRRPWEDCIGSHATETDRRPPEVTRWPPAGNVGASTSWCSQPPSETSIAVKVSRFSSTAPHESPLCSAMPGESSVGRPGPPPSTRTSPRLQDDGRLRWSDPRGPREMRCEPAASAVSSIGSFKTPWQGCSGLDPIAASPVSPTGSHEQAFALARSEERGAGARSDVTGSEQMDGRRCRDNSRARQQLHELGLGLRQLETELQRGLDGPARCESTPDVEGELAATRHALDWTLSSIRHGRQMVRTLVRTAYASSTGASLPSRLDLREAPGSEETRRPRPLAIGPLHVRPDGGDDRRRRSLSMDRFALDPVAAHSPTSRFLPPPTPVSCFSGPHVPPPLISPSSPVSQEVQRTHVQDLQHRISTKTLALQTLQQEHERLLAAYSRSQTRGAVLDRRSRVSDDEMTNLINLAVDTQVALEAAEARVTKLTQQRDQLQAELTKLREQYTMIIRQATQLQTMDLEARKRDRAMIEDLRRTVDMLALERDEALKLVAQGQCSSAPAEETGVPTANTPPTIGDWNPTNDSRHHTASPQLISGNEAYRTQSETTDEKDGTVENDDTTNPTSVEDLPEEAVPTESEATDEMDETVDNDDTINSTTVEDFHHETIQTESETTNGADEIVENDDIINSTSVEDLHREIIRLREMCRAKDAVLQDLHKGSWRIDLAMNHVAKMGREMAVKAEGARTMSLKRSRETEDDDGGRMRRHGAVGDDGGHGSDANDGGHGGHGRDVGASEHEEGDGMVVLMDES